MTYAERLARDLEKLVSLTNPAVEKELLEAFHEDKVGGHIMGTFEFVEQNYEMNPETEELLPDGSYLRDGMTILFAQPNKRASTTRDEEGEIPDWMMGRILAQNRWFTISEVDISTKYGTVLFTATFADGRWRRSERSLNIEWLVKSNTTPKFKRYNAVLELVNRAMEEQRAGSLVTDVEMPIGISDGHFFDERECAERIARQINDLID